MRVAHPATHEKIMLLWWAFAGIGIGIGIAVAIAIAIGHCIPIRPIATAIAIPTLLALAVFEAVSYARGAHPATHEKGNLPPRTFYTGS